VSRAGTTNGKLLLGLIGAGIQESRTPAMHEREASEQGLKCIYQLIDMEKLGVGTEALPQLLSAAEWTGYSGLNITHPCKQAILPLLTDLTEDARRLGAVNTVILRDGRRIGHNTDWWGFAESFRRNLPDVSLGRIVQLGAGGAGSATAYAALTLGAGHVIIFDPVVERVERLTAMLNACFVGRASIGSCLTEALAGADGLIHATPIGMAKYPGLPLSASLLRRELWVADIVYFPLETELLQLARRMGCRVLSGAGMAIFQAVQAFRLFTGLEPDVDRMERCFHSFGEPA